MELYPGDLLKRASLPIFGVQWHPERMCLDNAREDTVSGLSIFEYFVSICREKRDEN